MASEKPPFPTSSASPFSLSLDDAPLEERFDDGRRPVVVASFPTPIEAELARSRLEAEGIASDLLDLHTASIGGPLALVRDGDTISIDAERNVLDWNVDEEEARRRCVDLLDRVHLADARGLMERPSDVCYR